MVWKPKHGDRTEAVTAGWRPVCTCGWHGEETNDLAGAFEAVATHRRQARRLERFVVR